MLDKSLHDRNEKSEILVDKSVLSRLSILELSKILIYEFLYDCVKWKYGEKPHLCYMDTDIHKNR